MNKRLLVICGHTADFCSRSGGTIIKYLELGWEAKIISLTFGERGESREFWTADPSASVEACKAQRKKEALAAAAFMGVSIEFKDWDDYPLFISCEQQSELARDIQDYEPAVLLTHFNNDPFNYDHQETSLAVIKAAGYATAARLRDPFKTIAMPDIFMFESTVPQTEFNGFAPDTYVDITGVFEKKMKALAHFTSQPFLGEFYTTYALYRGRQAAAWSKNTKITHAEGFKRYVPYVGATLPLRDTK